MAFIELEKYIYLLLLVPGSFNGEVRTMNYIFTYMWHLDGLGEYFWNQKSQHEHALMQNTLDMQKNNKLWHYLNEGKIVILHARELFDGRNEYLKNYFGAKV